ncbi:MAG TPA: alanine racemase [Arthrobacter sp.]|nr:alanine racemase [Arthrobacter sp.]
MITTFDDERIGFRFKGLPADAADLTLGEFAGQQRPILSGGFSWPAMTLRLSAVEHNADLMARYVKSHNLQIAPHLKTSMSPALAAIAEGAGIWGVTVANPFQARVFMAAGAQSIFLANEVLEPAFVRDISAWQARGDRRFICYVDSPRGVQILDQYAVDGLDVVIEIGHSGGRAGVRSLEDAANVAKAVRRSKHLHLRGVGGYEGSVSHGRTTEDVAAVRKYLGTMAEALRIIAADCASGAPLIASAGGSLYFDCVADVLGPENFDELDVLTIIRSGAYLTHDSDFYARRSPLDSGRNESVGQLLPSIEVWAQILSRPEPGLIIAGAGRRDVNSDSGLPLPRKAIPFNDEAGQRDVSNWNVFELNDQHAFIQVPDDDPAQPGDLVTLAISHPCTLHQRWSAPLLIDDDDRVVGIARSYF